MSIVFLASLAAIFNGQLTESPARLQIAGGPPGPRVPAQEAPRNHPGGALSSRARSPASHPLISHTDLKRIPSNGKRGYPLAPTCHHPSSIPPVTDEKKRPASCTKSQPRATESNRSQPASSAAIRPNHPKSRRGPIFEMAPTGFETATPGQEPGALTIEPRLPRSCCRPSQTSMIFGTIPKGTDGVQE